MGYLTEIPPYGGNMTAQVGKENETVPWRYAYYIIMKITVLMRAEGGF